MRICIVGGIFGRTPSGRASHLVSPETLLADGLRRRGHHVSTVGHDAFTATAGFDVIHVHHVGRAAYLAAATRTEAPFVFTPHDGLMLCGEQKSLARRAAFEFVVRAADAVVALSDRERLFLARYVRNGQVAVIPNGVDTTYSAQPSGADRAERDGILFVGQLIHLKNVDVLIEAYAASRLRNRLRLVYQNAQLERRLRDLAGSLGVADRVDFLGPRSPEELAALYAASEALVLPSQAEALPSVITEALLSGTLVIASAVGGIPEQLGGHGLLVNPRDKISLARALVAAVQSPPARDARRAMREHAVARFSVDSMVDAHVRLYSACGESPRRGHRPLYAPLARAMVRAYWGPARKGEA